MKRIFTTILFLHFLFSAHSQVGVQLGVMRPIGEFGSVMKPGFCLEVNGGKFFTESMFRFSWAANFQLFTPRLNEFRAFGVQYEGSTTTVFPGTISYKPYASVNACVGVDFTPLKSGKVFPYIGIDLVAGVYRHQYSSSIEQIESTNETIISPLIGGRTKVGLEYMVADYTSLFVQYTLGTGINFQAGMTTPAWGVGLGVKHEF
jgi:hypothetical protein